MTLVAVLLGAWVAVSFALGGAWVLLQARRPVARSTDTDAVVPGQRAAAQDTAEARDRVRL